MISAWTKHLPREAHEQFKREILGSKQVLIRLQELLNEKEAEIENLELYEKAYDVPNWSHRQADINGYKRCLKYVSKLINLDQQEP